MQLQVQSRRLIRSFVAVVAATALLTVLAATSALASEHKTLSLVKRCSDTSPTCVVITSTFKLLLGSTFIYLAPQNLDTTGSPMLLQTGPGKRPGIANGICHFYATTGTGHCEFAGGQGSLRGFHANLAGAWLGGSDFSLAGPYWFDRHHNDYEHEV